MNPDPHTAITLGTPSRLQLQVSPFGARWLSCRVALGDGSHRETLLGHPTPADHARQPGYFGAVVGRYANRLAGARFTLDGREHRLVANEGPNQLHGGPEGFDRRVWAEVERSPLHLRLALHSPDGDQGYPGALDAEVLYRVHEDGLGLSIEFTARATAPCPVSLTSHPYFNLDGAPTTTVHSHRLQIAAAHMLPVRPDMIPTGDIAPVAGTPFDLQRPTRIGDGLGQGEQQRLGSGYDHCFVLDDAAARGTQPAAVLTSADGRLALKLYTDYPGLQVCSGNHVHQALGRHGQPLPRHAGIALEPQFFPDAPNQPAWAGQGCILRPGHTLQRAMRIRFEVDPH